MIELQGTPAPSSLIGASQNDACANLFDATTDAYKALDHTRDTLNHDVNISCLQYKSNYNLINIRGFYGT
jgi:hypothetical protein